MMARYMSQCLSLFREACLKVAIEVAGLPPSLLSSQTMSLKQRLLYVRRKIRRCSDMNRTPLSPSPS
nr:hypothetical protein [Tanacetum cinerariifolium]